MPAQAKFCSQCGSPRAAPLGSVPLRPPRSPHAPNAATRWLLVGAALVVAAAGWLAFKPGMLPTGGNADSPAADAPTDASKAATLVGPQGAAGSAGAAGTVGTVATPDQPVAATPTAPPGTPPGTAPVASGAAVPATPASTAPATPAPAVAANPPPAVRPATTAPTAPHSPRGRSHTGARCRGQGRAGPRRVGPGGTATVPRTNPFSGGATPGAQRHAHTE